MLLSMPAWWKVASIRDRPEKLAAVTDRRQALIDEMDSLARRPGGGLGAGGFVVRDVVHERNNDLIGRSIDEIARERGASSGETVVDLTLDEDLGTWFIRESIGHNNSPVVGELLAHPYVHVGASDGGAHVGSFSTFGDTGYPVLRVRARHEVAQPRGGGEEDHARPGDDLGAEGPWAARRGERRRRGGVRRRQHRARTGDRVRRLPRRRRPLDPPAGGRRHRRRERRDHLERRRRLRGRRPRRAGRAPARELHCPPVAGRTW